jgi:chemotaxis protein methyltransferase CheR
MTTNLPSELLLQVSERIEAAVGLHFPQERLPELDRKIRLAARELAFLDPGAFAHWILSSPFADDQIRRLAGHLHIEETYFFRDPRVWGLLQNTILPPLIASREGINQRLRLWSAACSTGEEAYSLAIALDQIALPNRQDWKCMILATEINPNALSSAQLGIYSPWSFRRTSPSIRARYFRPLTNGQFAVRPEIKKMVTFAQANLASSTSIPNSGLMDVIFCRNIFFYFTPERVKRVLERFYDTLVDGGWLIVGPEESSYFTASPFVPVVEQGITAYRKELPSSRGAVVMPAAQTGASTALPRSHPRPVPPPPTVPAPHPGLRPVPSPPVAGTVTPKSTPQPQATAASPPVPSSLSSQPETSYEQAYAWYERGQYDLVVNLLLPRCRTGGDPHSLTPISTQEFALLARTYANQGHLTDAQYWCEQALQHNPSNPSLHYLLATIFLEQERIPDAVHAFHGALAVNPDFALAHFALGNLLQQKHRHEEARHHLSNAFAILQRTSPDVVLPDTPGLTAGRLIELVDVMRRR